MQEIMNIGDYRVVEIKEKKHLLKCVESESPIGNGCLGCSFVSQGKKPTCKMPYMCDTDKPNWNGCPVLLKSLMVLKDLGALNEEGLLPCPRCGSYPRIIDDDDGYFSFFHICTGDDDAMVKTESRLYHSRQECVNACNRRA